MYERHAGSHSKLDGECANGIYPCGSGDEYYHPRLMVSYKSTKWLTIPRQQFSVNFYTDRGQVAGYIIVNAQGTALPIAVPQTGRPSHLSLLLAARAALCNLAASLSIIDFSFLWVREGVGTSLWSKLSRPLTKGSGGAWRLCYARALPGLKTLIRHLALSRSFSL